MIDGNSHTGGTRAQSTLFRFQRIDEAAIRFYSSNGPKYHQKANYAANTIMVRRASGIV